MDDHIPDDELAHHEAGHAVVSSVLGFPPDYVTIARDGSAAGASGHAGGYKMVHGLGNLDQMTVSYAGYAAHVKYAPDAGERALRGARNDFGKAEKCMDVLPLGPGEREALMQLKRSEAAKLVDEEWPAVQHVARALQVEKTISSARLQELIDGAVG